MSRLKRASAFAVLLAAGLAAWAATRPAEIAFARHMIDPGAYETCAVGDINREYYRSKQEEQEWKTKRDPIKNMGEWLAVQKIADGGALKKIDLEKTESFGVNRVEQLSWRQLLDEHDKQADRIVREHRGRFVRSTGDGVLATFDGPARAVRCG